MPSRTSNVVIAGIITLAIALSPTVAPASATPLESATAAIRPVPAAAVTGFSAGNIISNEVFFATDTMSAAEIQSFLVDKVRSCQSGYTCLKDYAQATTTRPADLMCTSTYQGSSRQTAAEIVYAVAQACGINPQVLLVMLQKEQGLVTHTWPSDWRYTIAMGQGCPDTAACDTTYYGFFNQVYGAAWQLKRYANPAGTSQYFTWYAPGRTWNVRYHPDAACGSAPVLVANQATANLYYYTPYQPNAASLAAGYGEGDGCSSYGNRNFFTYFTEWFGSTQTRNGGAVTAAYEALGGAAGFLGAPLGSVRCGLVGEGCFQTYAGGVIYWTAATGAWALSGSVRDVWSALDYERGLGYPLGAQVCGLPDWGCFQDFQRGVIYSSVEGTFALAGAIRQKWAEMDYERGLGYPVSAQKCLPDGACYQDFQRGVLYTSPAGTFALQGEIRTVWNSLDYERGLGLPVGNLTCLPDGGCFQDFQNGVIYSSAAGTFGLTGAIRQQWAAMDYERGLGYPVSAQTCLAGGACYQDFQRGVLYDWAGGTFALQGEIRSVWNSLDYERGLGLPAGHRTCLPDGACYQDFQAGVIYSSPEGTFGLSGPIRQKWIELDYERGLGYPTSAQQCGLADGGCAQDFERGTITWTSSAGARVVT